MSGPQSGSDSGTEPAESEPAEPDPFGRALLDHCRGERAEPLVQREDGTTREHPVDAFYFEPFTADGEHGAWVADRLDGPLVDLGAGAGRHALYFQERFEAVAVERSERLVETMRERGVRDARLVDMFALRKGFDRDRFRSALAVGTQVGLAGSRQGLRRFLGDLAHVTTPDATAVLDCYDPDHPAAASLLGYRPDPTPGLASRVVAFEYDGEVEPTLLFRLFGPDRLREAAVGTGWTVDEIRRVGGDSPRYLAALGTR